MPGSPGNLGEKGPQGNTGPQGPVGEPGPRVNEKLILKKINNNISLILRDLLEEMEALDLRDY